METSTNNNLMSRPPVVAVMGHIDHGKSTLIDYIRKTNTTEKEAGGITQHISAYEVMHKQSDGREFKITFLDTPGHEAFQGIRSRGANIADIAILIVSAEDGVKPQTVEAYNNIKNSSAPFIVAITKVDKPSADIDRTKQSLAENEIYVEGYGGNISVVPVSAKTGQGVDELLDMILLTAELEGFMTENEVPGSGIVVESHHDPKQGITAVGIIKNGTIARGMFAASAGTMTPLRFILDSESNMVEELSASSPIQMAGWNSLPIVGSEFKTFLKKDEAIEYAESLKALETDELNEVPVEGITLLPLIIKADTAGSLEAIKNEVKKLGNDKIKPKIILSGVGSVSESDVRYGQSTEGLVVIGFNTKVDSQANALLERLGTTVASFNIIYELTDKIKELLAEREPKIQVEEVSGVAKVLKIFSANKDKQVIGARVTTGIVTKNSSVKIKRRDEEIGRGKIKELQQSKVAVDHVSEDTEFGTMIESKCEIAPGDILEVVITTTK